MSNSVRLDVKKNTFKKYIVTAGFNYNILQYDDFIETIKRLIITNLKKSIINNQIKETTFKIFSNDDISINILHDTYKLDRFNLDYLKELIEDGYLDLYLEEESKNVEFSEKVKGDAFIFKLINEKYSNEYFKRSIFSALNINTNKSSSQYINIIKCFNLNDFQLSPEKENNLIKTIDYVIKRHILNNNRYLLNQILYTSNFGEYPSNNKEILDPKSADRIISIYLKNNFLSDGIEDINLSFNKNEFSTLFNKISANINIYLSSYGDDGIGIIKAIYFNKKEYLPRRFSSLSIYNDTESPVDIISSYVSYNEILFIYADIAELKKIDISSIKISLNGFDMNIAEFKEDLAK